MITVVHTVDVKNPEDCPFQYYLPGRMEEICSYIRGVCKPLGKSAQDKCPLKGNCQVIVKPKEKKEGEDES